MSRKLPENILAVDENGTVIPSPIGGAYAMLIKKFKLTPFTPEGAEAPIEPSELVKNLFILHFNAGEDTPEAPEGFEKLKNFSKLFDNVGDMVKDHKAAEAKAKDTDAAAKEAKRQQREADKNAKESEEKEFLANQEAFTNLFMQKYGELDYSERIVKNVIGAIKLPDKIQLTQNGTGVVIGETATKEDVSAAIATVLNVMEGKAGLESALQFILGDLVNEAVKKKVFRTKNDAQSHVAFVIADKMKKTFSPGSLSQYALMAERIPGDKRKTGISPSVYLLASKVAVPKLKDATPQKKAELEAAFAEQRNNVIDQINEGTIKTTKDVQKVHEEFLKSKDLVETPTESVNQKIARALHNYFAADFSQEYLKGLEEPDTVVFVDENGVEIKMPIGEVTDKKEEAKRILLEHLILDSAAIIKGSAELEDKEPVLDDKGQPVLTSDGKPKTKKVKKTVKVRLQYPFRSEPQ